MQVAVGRRLWATPQPIRAGSTPCVHELLQCAMRHGSPSRRMVEACAAAAAAANAAAAHSSLHSIIALQVSSRCKHWVVTWMHAGRHCSTVIAHSNIGRVKQLAHLRRR
jgi:hypothetical protein